MRMIESVEELEVMGKVVLGSSLICYAHHLLRGPRSRQSSSLLSTNLANSHSCQHFKTSPNSSSSIQTPLLVPRGSHCMTRGQDPPCSRLLSPVAGTPNILQKLLTCTDLMSSNQGPVTNANDACKWLDSKGWILAGEPYDRAKLARILLTAALLPKVPNEAIAAIRVVAFLIKENITDNLSTQLAAAVADKVNALLLDTKADLATAKTFLKANSIQQASTSIELKEVAAQHASTTNNLNTLTMKLSTLSLPKESPAPHWPSVLTSQPPPTTNIPRNFDLKAPAHHTRIQQCLLSTAHTILIQTDHKEKFTSQEPTLNSISKLRVDINKRLQQLDEVETAWEDEDTINRTKTLVCGIRPLDQGAFLLDLDSPESADRFKTYVTNPGSSLLPTFFGNAATLKPKGHNIIFKFVPCTGGFDPSNKAHLSEIENNNNLKPGSISSAAWLKQADRHANNQTVTSLKVICSSPESANHLLRERTYISGHVVAVTKDLREPLCCNKCQTYGHIHASCTGQETCAHCTSKSHSTDKCPLNQSPGCVSCRPSLHHCSYYHKCPIFISKCEALDARYPENNMPYFPTDEPWTWAQDPPKLSTSPPIHKPHRDLSLPSYPQDGGWTQVPAHRQTTLNNFTAPGTSQTQPNQSLPSSSPPQ